SASTRQSPAARCASPECQLSSTGLAPRSASMAGLRNGNAKRNGAQTGGAPRSMCRNGARKSRLSTAETRDEIGHVPRERHLEGQLAAIAGVVERQAMRVERLSWKRDRPQFIRAVDVTDLPDQRVAA